MMTNRSWLLLSILAALVAVAVLLTVVWTLGVCTFSLCFDDFYHAIDIVVRSTRG